MMKKEKRNSFSKVFLSHRNEFLGRGYFLSWSRRSKPLTTISGMVFRVRGLASYITIAKLKVPFYAVVVDDCGVEMRGLESRCSLCATRNREGMKERAEGGGFPPVLIPIYATAQSVTTAEAYHPVYGRELERNFFFFLRFT